MINLIPPSAKARIRTEYWMRTGALWLFALAAAAVIVAVALLPTHMLIQTQVQYYGGSIADVVREGDGSQSAVRQLQSANEAARMIIDQAAAPAFMPIVDVVTSAAARDGVTITGFEFARASNVIAPVRVSGTAPDRTSLAAFRDALVADSRVEQVELPISNFAKNRDIEFSLLLVVGSSTTGI